MKIQLLDWLLEEENPGVRHATLTTLMGRLADDLDVRKAQSALMDEDPVRTILLHQEPEGHWSAPERFYVHKFRGTVWQVIFLAQLGADPEDERMRKGCEFLFTWSQNRKTGGFTHRGSPSFGGTGDGLPCLTGNLVCSLQHFGYTQDERWRRAMDWLLATQQPDGGWGHGGHSCFQGSIKPLKALVSLPIAFRSAPVENAVQRAISFFLQHRLFRRDHHGFDVAKLQHLRLGYPLAWHTDVLEMLDVITAAGITSDEALADAVAIVISKRDKTGRWRRENIYHQRPVGGTWCKMENKNKPSKWVTLRALRTLNRIGESKVIELSELRSCVEQGVL